MLADGCEGFFAQIVFDLAGVLPRGLFVDADADEKLRQRLVPGIDPVCDLHAAFGQCNQPVAIHGDKAVLF